ncbi:unnamed protein product [Orchesella dallaii]|uniref:Spaetzle domain-containing protein n=1 Tax=Orchesella dallaii TaxID=48710 RepID=A0ABP1QP71_9HEXA
MTLRLPNGRDGMLAISLALAAILVQIIDGERFHPASPQRPTKPDPIDPTGRGSPGIVIVYKKNDRPPQSHQNSYYPPSNNYDDYHHHHPPPPHHHGKYKPTCAGSGDNYCLYDQEYPMDKVSNIAQHYQNQLQPLYEEMNHYSLTDYISHDNATHRYRHKGHFICESDVSYVRPGWAKNWKGEWVAVLNTDVFPQSVRIETCKYPKKKCEYMPPCYKSYCVQRYTYVKLICLDPYNPGKRPTTDVFEIPSACSCFVESFPIY